LITFLSSIDKYSGFFSTWSPIALIIDNCLYLFRKSPFVYPWIFLEPRYITSKTERKNYLSRVHFDFDGEKKYDSWGACISMEKAGNVVERINSFLEKQKEK
ncbi:hypothetical protein DLH72_05280, partial [Candidatus Gracilibacteria bacterium]